MRLIDPWRNDHYGQRDEDVPALQAALIKRDVWASKEAILQAWESYSDSHAAGWLSPYEEDDETVSEYALDRLMDELTGEDE
jgi:hypothetical protein